MKVLLTKVPSNIHVVSPPLSLAYLSAVIKGKCEVRILDCLKEGFSFQDFRNYVKSYRPDVIGFTAFTLEMHSALECAKIAKSIDKKIMTVIGGPHASTSPIDLLKNENVDFIFVGEAEIGFPKLIDALKKKSKNMKNIPGLGYKQIKNKKTKMMLNPHKFVENLDDVPFPDLDSLNFKSYPKLYLAKKHPSAPILTSRGCPFSCTFCTGNKISGKKFRFRSPENIIEEIKLLKKRYDIKEFQIWDDNFTLNKERAKKFCDMLIKEDLGLAWWCPNGVRLETLDKELMMKMRKSGCYAIAFGIESGSEKIQRDMKKNLNFKQLEEAVNFAHKTGMRTQGFFIIGYPTETKEDILKTIELSKKLPLDRASISLFQPLFGSEIYYDMKKKNMLPENYSLDNCDYSKPSVLLKGFSNLSEIKKMQRKALLEFYLRPRVFFRFAAENFSPSQIKEILLMVRKYIIGR